MYGIRSIIIVIHILCALLIIVFTGLVYHINGPNCYSALEYIAIFGYNFCNIIIIAFVATSL